MSPEAEVKLRNILRDLERADALTRGDRDSLIMRMDSNQDVPADLRMMVADYFQAEGEVMLQVVSLIDWIQRYCCAVES
jgi:hypothetical protein